MHHMTAIDSEARRLSIWPGLFLVTSATLMYEILLTRIFSVTMWYHFAFVAISVAMFGMTAGAIVVYLAPNYFGPQRLQYHLALSALLFAISMVMSFLTHLSIPFVIHFSFIGLYSIALTYAVLSIPFVFSGMCVCLCLTRFPGQVGRLYAADLAGAAVGCILIIYTLEMTDGPTSVIVSALFASLGAYFFARPIGGGNIRRLAYACSFALAVFTVVNTVLVIQQRPLLRLMWVRGELEPRPLYEKWNSFSRITVHTSSDKPFGWGQSSTYPTSRKVRELDLTIDAFADTVLTAFSSDKDLEHLKYDVTNVAHYVKRDAKVLVIGVGGGRDILSALAFGQRAVLGVELNKNIIEALTNEFGDFTQHVDRNPAVTIVNDEARSYLARQSNKFDIIQASLIDTYAATAAGAFILSESSLYTTEAWNIFLQHLNPDGILTFSRWWSPQNVGELYRLTALASASLMQQGVANPRDHLVIVRNIPLKESLGEDEAWAVGTILVKTVPFSDRELSILEDVSRRMQFEMILSPRVARDQIFEALASGRDLEATTRNFALNIAPPTDDSPFFFQLLRLHDVFQTNVWRTGYLGKMDINSNLRAVFVLGILVIVVIGLTLLCIIAPLIATADPPSLRGALPLIIFFLCIGLGFMFIEVSQMQRLIIFLGHPTYGLSVVLFVLLMASGMGSYTTQRINADLSRPVIVRLCTLISVLAALGAVTPYALREFQASTIVVRILVSVSILFPLGVFMGMAFPLGLKVASLKPLSITPWLWGVNGAASVCASVLAIVIAMSASISAAFWTGVSCYVVAAIALVWAIHGWRSDREGMPLESSDEKDINEEQLAPVGSHGW
jgi:hypothetical protein